MKCCLAAAFVYLLLLGLFTWLHSLFLVSGAGCMYALLAAGGVAVLLAVWGLLRHPGGPLLSVAFLAGVALSLFAWALAGEQLASRVVHVSPPDIMVYVYATDDGGLCYSLAEPPPDRRGQAVSFSPHFPHRFPMLALFCGLCFVTSAFGYRQYRKWAELVHMK